MQHQLHSKARWLGTLLAAATLFSATSVWAQTVTLDPTEVHQTVQGFGGMNGAGWIADLTPAQVDLAFGSDNGQIGLSIMRMRIDPFSSGWRLQVPSAVRARSHGAMLLATPWSAPAYMKSNNSLNNGGKLLPQYYGAYAKHLQDFAAYMAGQGAPVYAMSLQNEPDWHPDYESGDWDGTDFLNFIMAQGAGFGNVKLLASESFSSNTALTDPVLDSDAAQYVGLVGGHLYGVQPKDYALADSKGKPVWMTEHFTDNTDGNAWPSALGVASELHNSMLANYSAYVWWYIRRGYGLIAEDGTVSKRGYVMSQYARFVRPGSTRIGATPAPYADVAASAYQTPDGKTVLVVVNTGNQFRQITLNIPDGSATTAFTKYSTSATVNVGYGGKYRITGGQTTFWADPQSVATLVSE
ncbi:xylanase [Paracidovorax avenae]|uniref:glycoside hydrolase family 30 beta sandwich domain-containing protein n=1 Tax=Paracidovorax avenae TaxID=80867 RepID=UPI000D15EF61|nr:glycoside hydrolase family 30 beta sandwich domain-containing protein [Paracidovorax avenae]AVS72003.1 xylanase [Paracidovorax avenae]